MPLQAKPEQEINSLRKENMGRLRRSLTTPSSSSSRLSFLSSYSNPRLDPSHSLSDNSRAPVRSTWVLDPYLAALASYGTIGAGIGSGFVQNATLLSLCKVHGHKLLYAIGNVTHLPITHLIYSHSHADHIGGAIILLADHDDDDVTTIAHSETSILLAAVHDPNRPLPKVTFTDDYSLKLGNQTLELTYKGPNHLEGNTFIYAPASKVLMLVDVVFPGWIPFSGLGVVKNVPGFIRAHDQILEYDFLHFVGGHLDRSGTRDDVLIQREYVQDLFDNCAETVRLTGTDDPALGGANILGPVLAQNPGNPWAAFRVDLEVTAGDCANKTNEKWVGRLAGSDVFQFSNAETMVESLRIDYGVLGAFANT